MKARLTSIVASACLLLALAFSQPAAAFIGISVSIAPPAIPIYTQPICPGDGYLWTPGYWAWDTDFADYYWVPGTWLLPPRVGFLWTPGYWGWSDSAYVFHTGYWGPTIGFYGGIDYGFGYGGIGFEGGYWSSGRFFYNRSVTHIDETVIHNVYNKTVINNNVTINRVSFNGGNGGVQVQPTAAQRAAERETHLPPTQAQARQIDGARSNPQFRAAVNLGRPLVAATQRPGEFKGTHITAATQAGAPYHPSDRPPAARNARVTHASEVRIPAPSSEQARSRPDQGSGASQSPGANQRLQLDEKARTEQQSMYRRQEQERQDLQSHQEAEHRRMMSEAANEQRRQQMEFQHQRQTEEMMQRHQQEQHALEQQYQHAHQREREHEYPH